MYLCVYNKKVFVCLDVSMSLFQSVYLSARPLINPSRRLSISLSVCSLSGCLHVCISGTVLYKINFSFIYYFYFFVESPSTPSITGNNPVFENQILTLTCYAQSLSLPEEMRNQSFVEYTWSGAYTGVGSTVTIGPLQRQDDGSNVTCKAKEQQASDRLHTESTVKLTVYCKYCIYFSYILNICKG